MRLYKRFDFFIQVLLIAGSPIYALLMKGDAFITGYFVTGGWQLLSCLIHFIFNGYYPSPNRKYYLRTILVMIIIAIICIPVLYAGELALLVLGYGFVLLAVSPGLAVWYAFICYSENKVLEHKTLLHLK